MITTLLLVSLAAAETDEVGRDDTYNNNGDMLKLVVFEADEAAAITAVDFAVYNYYSDGDVILVFYRQNGQGDFELVEEVDAQELPDREGGWATTGDVTWLVEPGDVFALGVWIASDWYYYYSESESGDIWFGEVLGGQRYECDGPVEDYSAEIEEYYYWMQVESEPSDADGDGVAAEIYGGSDCDDDDASAYPGAEETPYDDIDQDCDGADLSDVDGDGVDAETAGGSDCVDDDAGISPDAEDTCGDGIDQDCDGADLDCDDPAAQGQDGKLDLSAEGCGCATGGEPMGFAASFGAGLALLALARRRRR